MAETPSRSGRGFQLVDKEVRQAQTTSSEQRLQRPRRCACSTYRGVGGYPPPWGRGSQFGILFRDQQGILGLPQAIVPAFTRRRQVYRGEDHAAVVSFPLLGRTGPHLRYWIARQSEGRWIPTGHGSVPTLGGEVRKGSPIPPWGMVPRRGVNPRYPVHSPKVSGIYSTRGFCRVSA